MDIYTTISNCLNGKREAHKALYESYMPYVLTIAKRYGSKSIDEADYVQEVFIKIFQSLPHYDKNKGPFKPWLRTIAVYTIINIIKRSKVLNTVNIEDVVPDQSSQINYDVYDTEYIIEAIADLPDGYRIVFNMYEIDGYSHKEISNLIHISESTSRSQLNRAKSLLRKTLTTKYEIPAS